MRKEIALAITISLLIFPQVQVGKSEHVQLSEESLIMNLKIDISENGSGFVSCSILGSVNHPINLSIPKTVEEYSCSGLVESLSFLDGFDYNSLQIEPLTNGTLDIEVFYSWPDCAVPFNGSCYVGSNELFPMYPTGTTVQSNITVILPPNATILRCDVSETKNETVQDRLHISFTKNGYQSTTYAESLPSIIFKQTVFRDDTALMEGAKIVLSYPITLSRWANRFFLYSSNAYNELYSVWGTRAAGKPLRINIVPAASIVDAAAYYNRGEDAIYFPAHWIFGVGYSLFRPVHVLFHEIGHAFTRFNLPYFMSEGLAEYASHELFAAKSLEENKKTMENPDYLENPLEDPKFNSTEFFDWNSRTVSYPQSFFAVYDLINFTGSASFRNFLSLLEKKDFNFAGYGQQDGYELLVYYLNTVSGKNTASFFSKYRWEVDTNRLSQRQSISTVAFGLESVVLLIFSYEAARFFFKRRMRPFLFSLVAISTFAVFSVALFISALSIEFLLSDWAVLIICMVPIASAVCFMLARRMRSNFARATDEE
jgi:hypothetical protein